MLSSAFKNFDMPLLPVLGLLIFILVFLGAIYYVIKKENKNLFIKMSQIPLNEGKDYE